MLLRAVSACCECQGSPSDPDAAEQRRMENRRSAMSASTDSGNSRAQPAVAHRGCGAERESIHAPTRDWPRVIGYRRHPQWAALRYCLLPHLDRAATCHSRNGKRELATYCLLPHLDRGATAHLRHYVASVARERVIAEEAGERSLRQHGREPSHLSA